MFQINLKQLLTLLPTGMRYAVLRAYCECILYSLHTLNVLLLNYRDSISYRNYHTPQVWALEKALNDRFDTDNRGIYIEDGERLSFVALCRRIDNSPKYLGKIYIVGSESNNNAIDFVIKIPSSNPVHRNISIKRALEKVTNYYKLPSKTFKIQSV